MSRSANSFAPTSHWANSQLAHFDLFPAGVVTQRACLFSIIKVNQRNKTTTTTTEPYHRSSHKWIC